MKNVYKASAFTSVQILALGLTSGDPTQLKPQMLTDSQTGAVQVMSDLEMRTLEASHLEVYNGCKWGHASFEPVQIESEELSAEILALHDEVNAA